MRSPEDLRTRWQQTIRCAGSLDELKLAVKTNGDSNPCVAGLRSVCWKIFLLFRSTDKGSWITKLNESRSSYTSLRSQLLRYIDRPGEVASAVDPLDEDPDSPWNVLRRDDEMRAEIFQDVERCMPDEPYFRQRAIQLLLLDILFIWCKLNPDVGYRQGMHEIVAPVLWVLEQDSFKRISEKDEQQDREQLMLAVLDNSFLEHDVFTIFSLIMQSAKSFYELGEQAKNTNTVAGAGISQNVVSPIVMRSKRIHEVYLVRVDPELADHLTAIEVLPQIFLIRWIRVLFGREFPFDNLLSLWDVIFAEDPTLGLIDMICVAMLLRIRWQLLDADYSSALSLLLKYPYPEPPHQPQTFVEDAVYLRENLCREGGSKLVWKYSGREPSPYSSASRPATPISARDQDQRASWSRSPLPSPAKLLQHQQRVESLLQGAAKGVLERGERLGINKAVRDAVVEARKNLQNLQTPQLPRRVSDLPRRSGEDGPMAHPMGVMNALEHRNKQLSQLLGEALHDLREASASQDKVAAAQKNAIDIAVAKIQFVQVYLEDSTMPLPLQAVSQAEEDPPSATAGHEPRLQPGPSSQTEGTPQDSPTLPTKPNIDLQSPPPASPTIGSGQTNVSLTPAQSISQAPAASMSQTPIQSPSPASRQVPDSSSITPATPPATNVTTQSTTHRPRAPIPTRSSLAQSSFAFMLEPTESSSSSAKPWTPKTSTAKTSSPFLASHRRPLSISAREKNKAFLFGEEPNDEEADTRRPTMRNDKKEEFDLDSIGNRSKKGR